MNRPDNTALADRLQYLECLRDVYPSIQSLYKEIINQTAIISLPKGTEHFISDIHGEYEAFCHILNNCSGVVREKAEDLFRDRRSPEEIAELLTLIYYPPDKLALLHAAEADTREWYARTLSDLTELARFMSSKYTRRKVRRAIPEAYGSIVDELLHAQPDEDNNQHVYHQKIIETMIDIRSAGEFVEALCTLIKRLAVDRLHIVGDIFDRGPRADYVMDAIAAHPSVDLTWGNHDILWMGAAAGSPVCMMAVVRNSLQYNNLNVLEIGYGISLRALALFAGKTYPTLEGEKSMLQAAAVMMFKLEGQLIARHPEYCMEDRRQLHLLAGCGDTLTLNGRLLHLKNNLLPTVSPEDPYALSPEETLVLKDLQKAFKQSERLHRHVRFLYEKGGMYRICNGNLLYHGCLPMTETGALASVCFNWKTYSGRALMDHHEETSRRAYFEHDPDSLDFMWYLWCGELSPLCGRQLKTFERMFFQEEDTWREPMNAYYRYCHTAEGCRMILREFSLNSEDSHIINGHTPVHVREGESPVKADGRLIVIDGGFCRAYQKTTGIAGYTLISNSHGLRIVAHHPFSSRKQAVTTNDDILSDSQFVCKFHRRMMVGDTDEGRIIVERIRILQELMSAYRSGQLTPKE